MAPDNNKKSAKSGREDLGRSDPNSKEKIVAAHEQAEEDIQQDADLNSHNPNDDLDEGETARLGEDKTNLV